MNKHFCEVGPRLNATVPIYKGINFIDFLPDKNNECTLHSFNEVSSDMIKSHHCPQIRLLLTSYH